MIEAIHNQIVFKPFLKEAETTGGMIVPEHLRTPSDRGEIISVGKGTKKRPMRLKKGMIGYRVSKWGTEIEINGEKCYIMEDSAILAID